MPKIGTSAGFFGVGAGEREKELAVRF